MQRPDLYQSVFAILKSIAPEIELEELDPDTPLRDQIDLDSMDYLNFIQGMHERLGVDIPERDYQELVSLNDIVNYLHKQRPV